MLWLQYGVYCALSHHSNISWHSPVPTKLSELRDCYVLGVLSFLIEKGHRIKIAGTWYLHLIQRLVSTISSVLFLRGMANYFYLKKKGTNNT